MKIIFIGYAVPNSEISLYSGSSVAGNKMQNGFLAGMNTSTNELYCLTIRPIASFPKDKKIIINKESLLLDFGIKCTAVGFINIPGLKQISQAITTTIELLKACKKGDVVLTFNTFPQVGLSALFVKKIKKIRFIPFVADLPIDDARSRSKFSRLLRKIFDSLTRYSLSRCDKLIVLNRHAADKFAPGKLYISIDGGVEKNEMNRFCKLNYHIKNIVYTGALTNYSGILNLIESINYLKDEDIYLDIYGSGDLENEVKEKTRINDKIRFYGKVSHNEVLTHQSNAWLLVNPRSIDDEIASVTFPSKIFEYLSSGTPVLSTKLNCFSDSYNEVMFFCNDNSPITIASKIKDIIKLDINEVRKITKTAYFFVLNKKNWDAHASNIINFIEN